VTSTPATPACVNAATRRFAYKLDVLRIEQGLIAEITTFEGHLFEPFGLPSTL